MEQREGESAVWQRKKDASEDYFKELRGPTSLPGRGRFDGLGPCCSLACCTWRVSLVCCSVIGSFLTTPKIWA